MHLKMSSAEACLLHVNAYIKEKFRQTDKQCGHRSDCSSGAVRSGSTLFATEAF